MRLAELRELPLPPTSVAEGAWDLARRRRRRTAVVGAVTTVVLVGATGVAVSAVSDGDHPSRRSLAPAASPSPTADGSTPPTITQLPDFAALSLTVPTLTPRDPTYLSEDPVDHALLAITPSWNGEDTSFTTVDVLGDDGRWRYVDVPGLVPVHDEGGYEGSVLTPTGLSRDGTRLALPQPDGVVVVDLTTGSHETYDVPGLNNATVWQDEDHLVVSVEGAARSKVLDLGDGTVSDSAFTADTGFAPDGSWVTWGRGDIRRPDDPTMTSGDGDPVVPAVRNDKGPQLTPPLVDAEVAVGLGGLDLHQGGSTIYKNVAGVPVLDWRTGQLRAFLYTEDPDTGLVMVHLLGLDGDTVTFAVGVSGQESRLLVTRWNWRTGAVTPVEVLEAGMVSGAP